MRMMRIIAASVLAAALFIPSSEVLADGSRAGALTLAPMAGGYRFEGNEDLDVNGFAAGVGLGYNLTKSLALEGMFTYADTELETGPGGDVDVYQYKLDLVYNILEYNGLEPYLAVGAGGITTSTDRAGSETDALVEYGGGLRYFATEDLALRADVKHIMPFDDFRNNLSYLFGIQYQIGGKTAPAPMAEPEPEPAPRPAPVKETPPPDTDGDGVIDAKDKCPGTPEGVKVDAAGCPLDTDGDGVYDYMDECPDTPRGAPVDKVGCPLDTDGDGVYDYMDECPDTPKGTQVDEKGCPPPMCITLNVQFDFDKSDIKPQYHDEIKSAADFLKKYAAGKDAVLEGHTDSRGDADYNRQLSQARAAAVMNYMVKNFGIEAKRLSAEGFGESQPIADNNTEEGRLKNRRVVLRICE